MSAGRSFVTRFLTSYSNKGISEMKKDLAELRKSMTDNRQEQKSLSKEIRDSEKEIKQITAHIRKTGQATEEESKRLEELTDKVSKSKDNLERLKVEQAHLQKQIDETNKNIEKQKTAFQELTSSMQDARTHAADVVKEIGAVGAAGVAAAAGLLSFTGEAAKWADDLNTLSKVTGIGTQELQKFAYASDLIDVSTETLTGSLTKLTRNMQNAAGGKGSAAEAFKRLDISVTDVAGSLRDKQEVFYEVIDALGRIGNETERDALAMNIFGKSAQELNPLILGGAEQLKELGLEAERAGLILDQHTLDSLNDFNDKLDLLKSKGGAIRHLAAAEMTPALEALLELGDELLDDVKKAADSGELKKTAKEIGDMLKRGAAALKNLITFAWKYRDVIIAGTKAMIAFKISMSITGLITDLVKAFTVLKPATDAATASVKGFNTATKANAIGVVVSLVVSLVTALRSLSASYAESTEEVKDAHAALNKYIESINDLHASKDKTLAGAAGEAAILDNLKQEYDELRAKKTLTAKESSRLSTVVEQLAHRLGITTQELRDQSGAYRDLTDDINTYIKSLENKALIEFYEEQIKQATVEKATFLSDLQRDIQKAELDMLAERKKFEREYGWTGAKFGDKYYKQNEGEYVEIHFDYSEYNRLTEEYKNLTEQLKDYDTIVEMCDAQTKKAAEELKKLRGETDKTAASADGLSDDLNSEGAALDTSAQKTQTLAEQLGELSRQSSSVRSEMTGLADSLSKLQKGESLSLSTLLELCDKYPDYAAELMNAAGNADLQRAALEKLFNARRQEYIMTQEAAIRKIEASNEETRVLLQNYEAQRLAAAFGAALSTAALSGGTGTLAYILNGVSDAMRSLSTFAGGEMQARARLAENERLLEGYRQKIAAAQGWTFADFASSTQTTAGTSGSGGRAASKTSAASKTADDPQKQANERLLEAQKLALAAYNRLVDNKIDLYQKEADAAQAAADKQIAALDAVMKKRNEEKEDAKKQEELNKINARLRYEQMDKFSRIELERRRQDLLNEMAETQWSRRIEQQKESIRAGADAVSDRTRTAVDRLTASKTQFANRMAYLQGTQSYDQRVQNNSKSVNFTIVQSGMSGDQVLKKIIDGVRKELGV